MEVTYRLYKLISTLLGEFLIKTSTFCNLFTDNANLTFFHKRSAKNIKATDTDKKKIWFYASSVGEAGICEIVINEILKTRRDISFHVSLMTDSGYEIAKSNLVTKADISFSPIDSLFNVRKTLNIIKPDVLCMVETEIWPNLIKEAGKRGIPVVVINARISNSSLSGYKKIRTLLEHVFKDIKEFNAASILDQNNLKEISSCKNIIKTTGNSKYDFEIDHNKIDKIKQRYIDLFNFEEKDRIIVCGSTRDKEESILLDTFIELKKVHKNLRLVIVPRHIKRVPSIESLIKERGLTFNKRSANIDQKKDIVLVDTLGELKDIYTIADIVFTGGSLVDLGGQNILEPAALEKAVVFGPYMDDFYEISQILIKDKGGFEADKKSIKEIFNNLLIDDDLRIQTGLNAFNSISKNRGAAKKQAKAIISYL